MDDGWIWCVCLCVCVRARVRACVRALKNISHTRHEWTHKQRLTHTDKLKAHTHTHTKHTH
jgi:hypothetical protein